MRPKALLSSALVVMLLTALAISYVTIIGGTAPVPRLSNFNSVAELNDFLDKARSAGLPGPFRWPTLEGVLADNALALDERAGGESYSTTNVQVEGVDEADWVKSDGKHLYIAGEDGITILRAYPPGEMAVISRIAKADLPRHDEYGWVQGLFLLDGRLIVLSTTGSGFVTLDVRTSMDIWQPMETRTYISIFDVADPAQPSLVHSLNISGSYQVSRLTSGHLYLLTHVFIHPEDEGYTYPSVCEGDGCEPFQVQRVYYDPDSQGAESYNIVLALDPVTGQSDYISVIAGWASTVYMSLSNLYVTFPKATQDGYRTSIYKIAVEGLDLRPAASGEVRGHLLNQFSMDEEGPYLRVVTTTGWNEANHVYVLGENLEMIGSLEDLAPGESVYSARFVGSALYLVTFKKVDPFFVIDLSVPSDPKVLGFLKIPGFSQYLHPWTDGLILGVGKDTVEAEEGDFAWFQGLKLSLFDVSDVGNPRELAKLIIGERGTESPVLSDHRAFLGITSRHLFVIPVLLVESHESRGWGAPEWQGVYVISATVEGFQVLGRVTHHDGMPLDYNYWYGPLSIHRSLYVGDYLYTVSGSMVKANSLSDLSDAGQVVYGSLEG